MDELVQLGFLFSRLQSFVDAHVNVTLASAAAGSSSSSSSSAHAASDEDDNADDDDDAALSRSSSSSSPWVAFLHRLKRPAPVPGLYVQALATGLQEILQDYRQRIVEVLLYVRDGPFVAGRSLIWIVQRLKAARIVCWLVFEPMRVTCFTIVV